MSLRICILETDNLRPELVEQYHGYGRMFELLFARQPIAAELTVYNVVQGDYPPADEQFDAYLVTGSKADSFGTDPWIQTLKVYLLELYQRGEKLLGICFGHQLLALLLGGRTERAVQGWGVGIHHYQLAPARPWMTPAMDKLTLLISHQDQVTALPENATVLASSEF
ncbi:GMP synthase - Glutamine amidotransferase domain protein [Pseudomonas syringae pv. syringae B301D]|nr:GMP synthase - Glutamine amidotransferase domain protein [Pseudomonas syringae pv. syringae B301D]